MHSTASAGSSSSSTRPQAVGSSAHQLSAATSNKRNPAHGRRTQDPMQRLQRAARIRYCTDRKDQGREPSSAAWKQFYPETPCGHAPEESDLLRGWCCRSPKPQSQDCTKSLDVSSLGKRIRRVYVKHEAVAPAGGSKKGFRGPLSKHLHLCFVNRASSSGMVGLDVCMLQARGVSVGRMCRCVLDVAASHSYIPNCFLVGHDLTASARCMFSFLVLSDHDG